VSPGEDVPRDCRERSRDRNALELSISRLYATRTCPLGDVQSSAEQMLPAALPVRETAAQARTWHRHCTPQDFRSRRCKALRITAAGLQEALNVGVLAVASLSRLAIPTVKADRGFREASANAANAALPVRSCGWPWTIAERTLAKPSGMADKEPDHRGSSFVPADRNTALYRADARRCHCSAHRARTRRSGARGSDLDHAGAAAWGKT
jgi:hypothetical protein